jgi:diguanylate cyclase (GGDEF)-like protein/PAS domain S-box-containing protein
MSLKNAHNPNLDAQSAVSWPVRLGFAESDNPYDTELVVDQISNLLKALPIFIIAYVVGILPIVLRGSLTQSFIVTITLTTVLLLATYLFMRSNFAEKVKPHARVIMLACIFGLNGLMFPMVIQQALVGQSPILALFGLATMNTIYVIVLSRIPAAFLADIVCTSISVCVIAPDPASLVLLTPQFLCAILILLKVSQNEFSSNRRRAQAEVEAGRASRLLNEFEQSGPGWFWETDRQGGIAYISPKVAGWLGVSVDSLIGQSMSRIAFEDVQTDDDAPLGERTLSFYMSTRTGFADVAIRAAATGEERWWSITGRPVVDQFGHFRGFVGSGSDLTEQRRSAAEVSRLARFDPLTGLANRGETSKLLRQAMAAQPGFVRPVGLMMIDLDRFKMVNDTMGHPAGDALLRQVSERLLKAAGRIGQVGRLGGDEFKVVFPGLIDVRQLAAIADGIISSLSRPYNINDTSVVIGASIGIAVAPEHGSTPEDIVRNADLALYSAKEAGRGVHRIYETGMHSSAEQRRIIENDMRRALAEGEFFLVYQSLVSTQTEQVIGYESLIRWNHPVHGLISPAKFIPIAEECGMIEQIGEWVLHTACREAAQWEKQVRVAVNVSAIQFANPKFPTIVTQALAQSGLAAARLELEITEGVFVADNEQTDRQFETLKSLGIRLALDDFGTGYSSLGYLKRAPFDKIKIDQSFIRGAASGQERNIAIIKSIVTLADALKMETTAEGVETHDQIELIKNLGCSHIQGFVYGKPIEGSALAHKLNTSGTQAERVGPKVARDPRYRVLRTATIEIEGASHHVRMRNISEGGVTVEFTGWAAEQSTVRIAITDGPVVAGIIRWVRDGKMGIAFTAPLDLRLLTQPLAKTG